MSYFSKFPKFEYTQDNKTSLVTDILRRSSFISEYKPYSDLYSSYAILDGETPQSLAYKYYGAATYHWVILMFNELHNPYFEWPVDSFTLKNICIEKYTETTMYMVRHYELDGLVVGEVKEFVDKNIPWIPPTDVEGRTPISFYDYEEQMNDAKRQILILRPELLGEFVTQFANTING
jgi:hypothetical protein